MLMSSKIDEQLALDLLPSKIYLSISILLYLLGFFAIFWYFYSIYLSLILSGVLLLLAYYFFPKSIFLTKPDSIKHIIIDSAGSISINHGRYAIFNCEYQSPFLVIISSGKRHIVVFKDALKSHSLSHLNRILR